MERVASLGVEILLRLFKYHDVVRSEILEQITARIVSRSASVMDFLELLACIIREHPESVERYMSNVSFFLLKATVYTMSTDLHSKCRSKTHWIFSPSCRSLLLSAYCMQFSPYQRQMINSEMA